MVSFCSVLETLVENSKELAQQTELVDQLKFELGKAKIQRDASGQDPARMDYYVQNSHRFVHNRQTDEWRIMGDVKTYTLREAIDVAASAEPEGDAA